MPCRPLAEVVDERLNFQGFYQAGSVEAGSHPTKRHELLEEPDEMKRTSQGHHHCTLNFGRETTIAMSSQNRYRKVIRQENNAVDIVYSFLEKCLSIFANLSAIWEDRPQPGAGLSAGPSQFRRQHAMATSVAPQGCWTRPSSTSVSLGKWWTQMVI